MGKPKKIFAVDNLLKYGILYLLILLIIISSFLSKNFFTLDNFLNVIRQMSSTVILAAGMALVIITAGIDLSVGSVVALSSMAVAGAMDSWNFNIGFAIIFAIIIGVVIGTINGLLIGYFKISPMIVTLATMNGSRGIAMLYNDGAQIIGLPSGFKTIGRGSILGLPVPILIAIVIVLIIFSLSRYTVIGKYFYAIGSNEKVAMLAGINIVKTKVIAYLLCSICASIVGVIFASRLNMGDPTVGSGLEMDAIASVILGGINLYGGSGNILGAVIGATFMAVLGNSLNLIGISTFWQMIVKAVVLIIAALVYSKREVD